MTAQEFHRFEKTVHRVGGATTVTRRFVVEERRDDVQARIEELEEDTHLWRTIRQWTIDNRGVTPAFPQETQA